MNGSCNPKRRVGNAMAILVAAFCVPAVGAQTEREEAWVSNHNRASNLVKQGQFREALAYYEKAIEQAIPIEGAESQTVGAITIDLAQAYSALADFAKSGPLYRRGLKIVEKALGKNHSEVANSHAMYGYMLYQAGQYDQALGEYKISLAIWKRHKQPQVSSICILYNYMGMLYFDVARLKLGPPDPNSADYRRAVYYFKKTLEAREKLLESDDPAIAFSLNNLAVVHITFDDFESAKPLLKRCLEIRLKKLGEKHPFVGTTYVNLGEVYRRTGEYQTAEEIYAKCLPILTARFGPNHPKVCNTKHYLAICCAAQRRWEEARVWIYQCRKAIHAFTRTTLPVLAEREQVNFIAKYHGIGIYTALTLGLQRADDPVMAEMAAECLLNAKGVALEVLGARAIVARNTSDPKIQRLVEELSKTRRDLARQVMQARLSGKRFPIGPLLRREELLSRALGESAAAEMRKKTWITIDQVRRRIPNDSILIEIIRLSPMNFRALKDNELWEAARYLALLIPPAGEAPVKVVSLGDADVIDRAVKRFQKAIQFAKKTSLRAEALKSERKVREA